MATVGLTTLYVGLKSDDGQVIKGENGLSESGIFEIDTNKGNGNLGTKSANITGLAGTLTKIMGNNKVVDVTKPDAAPSVAIDSNMINKVVKEKLLGRKKVNGAWVDQSLPVEAGLIVVSQTPIDLKHVYFAFGRGQFTESGQNVQTNTDTAQTREDDNLTYTAMGYDGFGGQAFGTFYEDDESFSEKKMFDVVFPGNTYNAGSGATTPTVTPGADNH